MPVSCTVRLKVPNPRPVRQSAQLQVMFDIFTTLQTDLISSEEQLIYVTKQACVFLYQFYVNGINFIDTKTSIYFFPPLLLFSSIFGIIL